MTQALPESPAFVWGRQRGGSIQVCSQKEEVWFRTDICQSLTDPSLPPGATAHPNKVCRGTHKGPPLKQLEQVVMPAPCTPNLLCLVSLAGQPEDLEFSFPLPGPQRKLWVGAQRKRSSSRCSSGRFSVITGRRILNMFLMRLEAPAGMCLWRPSACINRYSMTHSLLLA